LGTNPGRCLINLVRDNLQQCLWQLWYSEGALHRASCRRSIRIFDLDPSFRRTGFINRCEALRHDALQSKIAHGLKQFFAVTFGVLNVLDATTRTDQKFAES